MSNKNKKILKYVGIITIVFVIVAFSLTFRQKQVVEQKPQAVVLVGLPEKQTGLQRQIEKAFEDEKYVDLGDQLLKEGKTDEAIKQYNIAISKAKLSGDKGVALIHLANAYEKMRNYNRALETIIIVRDKYVNDWAKEPIIERATYLEYALQGNHDLAIEHAQKALEADAKLPNRPTTGRQDYIERLNDLKAAKNYILSLTKQ